MKTPEEIAREIANGAVKFDWNTGSAGFHTRRAMIQTYIFNVPVRVIPGENEDVVVAKFEKWAEPIRGRIATTLAVLVRAAISAERSAGLSDGGKDRKATPKLSAKPAPACARCGGRECVPRVYLGTGTVGEDDCPECRGKP